MTDEGSPQILIVEDHRLLAEALVLALRDAGMTAEISAAPTADAVLGAAEALRPDIVLLDLILDDAGTGLSLVAPLRERDARVLILSGVTDPMLLAACVEAGAAGLISKAGTFDCLVEQVRRVIENGDVLSRSERELLLAELRRHRTRHDPRAERLARLTERERYVLGALMDGLSPQGIAADACVSTATVRSQVHSILGKLGVKSQLAAVALAHGANWTPTPACNGALTGGSV
jgi:DNA-binding NarL/FixJ family response regulator